MNRTLRNINPNKWYHFETLKKFYIGRRIQTIRQNDLDGKEFTFIVFRQLFGNMTFIEHPKTKRLRINSYDSQREIGCRT